MGEVVFSGSSDDIVSIDVLGKPDEFNFYDGPYMGRFVIVDEDGSAMAIHAIYDGTWAFAPGMADEDVPLPSWPIRMEEDSGYSMRLIIEVPDTVSVQQT